ncbi:MAG: family 78 glycoside hydrolase catalytic domain [Puniceicoccaceae bacterium]
MKTYSPVNLRTNDLINPEGIAHADPTLTWELDTSSGIAKTSAFRIELASSKSDLLDRTGSLITTGWIEETAISSWTLKDANAQQLQKYWWQVQVRGQDGEESDWSSPASFRYALANEESWQAKWICSGWEGTLHEGAEVPCFRKNFTWEPSDTPDNSTSAILSITALGAYAVEVNGKPVGPDELGPGWTDYNKHVVYRSYDVTNLLTPGENAIGILLGDGWYCGHVGWGYRQAWGKAPQVMAQINVASAEGDQLLVGTDESWALGRSGILSSDLQMGEECDGSNFLSDWSSKKLDTSGWEKAKAAPPYKAEIIPACYPPVTPQEILKPVSTTGSLGEGNRIICNFGQNLVGRVAVELSGPAHAVLNIRYAERLDENGEIYTINLRKANNHDRYHLSGVGKEEWQTRFTTHGFQYVELTTDSAEVELLGIEAVVLHNDLDLKGSFSCSNPLLNQLHQNAKWGQKGNFMEVPTDCPQRNERLGWTGDIMVFMETALYHGNSRAFYTKWLRDMRDSQSDEGAIPPFVPWVPLVEDNMRDGGPAWSDAHVNCTWKLYKHTGRKDFLEQQYDSMVEYIKYLLKYQTKDYIRSHDEMEWQGFGDWLGLDGGHGLAGNTPKDLIGTAYLARSLEQIQLIAGELGKTSDEARFKEEREKTIAAFNRRFVTDEGLIASGTQTAYLLALKFGLLPEEKREAAAMNLVRNIRDRDWHLTTGFVGTPHICEIVADNGYLEDAYKLLEQTSYPSWLFPVKNGATTIWERWDGWTPEKGFQDPEMNSFNHYALGAVVAWLFKTVAGIRPAEPGFRRISFEPRPGGSLTWAKAEVPTPYGMTGLEWKLDEDKLELEVSVPVNSSAVLTIPSGYVNPDTTGLSTMEIEPGQHQISLVANS